ncbi:S-adenosyl-L-methionine-dependent methyltransferases superfamily protein [Perilla frutescens var. frutescens]|nr:S-adenosyl-L-methionine-dependent methyltransferases superfamily protein [Perilla frutescens var. frutescens]
MAKLFVKQAKQYAEARPTYPQELFNFIASHTPSHHLAWDVGTGTGQAALPLAAIYKKVVATDTSPNQLELAAKLPNITYHRTSAAVSMEELQTKIGSQSSFDLVLVAQALHWFDLPTFYHRVRWLLKKPDGVIAAWCYTTPEVNAAVDAVFQRFYTVDSDPYWDSARKLVDRKYESIDFPFEAAGGLEHTGPFRFNAEKEMDLEGFFTYLRSWSSYQTAKEKGVELLTDDVVQRITTAWLQDGATRKTVVFPIYLRMGKLGLLDSP